MPACLSAWAVGRVGLGWAGGAGAWCLVPACRLLALGPESIPCVFRLALCSFASGLFCVSWHAKVSEGWSRRVPRREPRLHPMTPGDVIFQLRGLGVPGAPGGGAAFWNPWF